MCKKSQNHEVIRGFYPEFGDNKDQTSCMQDLKNKSRNTEHATRNPKPESPNPKLHNCLIFYFFISLQKESKKTQGTISVRTKIAVNFLENKLGF